MANGTMANGTMAYRAIGIIHDDIRVARSVVATSVTEEYLAETKYSDRAMLRIFIWFSAVALRAGHQVVAPNNVSLVSCVMGRDRSPSFAHTILMIVRRHPSRIGATRCNVVSVLRIYASPAASA
jgi:hypothetical protein